MKILVIVGHPHFESSSVNKELLSCLGDDVTIHHVGNLEYTPETIEKERQLFREHDKIVFQYPLYYFGWTAAIQEWFENVFSTSSIWKSSQKMSFVITIGGSKGYYESNKHMITFFTNQGKIVTEYCGVKYGGIWVIYGNESLTEAKKQSYIKFIHE